MNVGAVSLVVHSSLCCFLRRFLHRHRGRGSVVVFFLLKQVIDSKYITLGQRFHRNQHSIHCSSNEGDQYSFVYTSPTRNSNDELFL